MNKTVFGQLTLGIKNTSDNPLPSYAHSTDSGMDIRTNEDTVIESNSYGNCGTGIYLDIPPGYEIQVRPRSGMAYKAGVFCLFGTVDTGYKGEIKIIIFNSSSVPYSVSKGDKVAQMVLAPIVRVGLIEEVDALGQSERGVSGIGSTGK